MVKLNCLYRFIIAEAFNCFCRIICYLHIELILSHYLLLMNSLGSVALNAIGPVALNAIGPVVLNVADAFNWSGHVIYFYHIYISTVGSNG